MSNEHNLAKLASGETVLFDKESRDLYIVNVDNDREVSLETARALASAGKGQHYDRNTLERLQQALIFVTVLGVVHPETRDRITE